MCCIFFLLTLVLEQTQSLLFHWCKWSVFISTQSRRISRQLTIHTFPLPSGGSSIKPACYTIHCSVNTRCVLQTAHNDWRLCNECVKICIIIWWRRNSIEATDGCNLTFIIFLLIFSKILVIVDNLFTTFLPCEYHCIETVWSEIGILFFPGFCDHGYTDYIYTVCKTVEIRLNRYMSSRILLYL